MDHEIHAALSVSPGRLPTDPTVEVTLYIPRSGAGAGGGGAGGVEGGQVPGAWTTTPLSQVTVAGGGGGAGGAT